MQLGAEPGVRVQRLELPRAVFHPSRQKAGSRKILGFRHIDPQHCFPLDPLPTWVPTRKCGSKGCHTTAKDKCRSRCFQPGSRTRSKLANRTGLLRVLQTVYSGIELPQSKVPQSELPFKPVLTASAKLVPFWVCFKATRGVP